MEQTRFPVTLLTGFLGAGKTTLLNAILADGDDEKVAVIVNEFGEAGLDHDLIEETRDDIVLMESGCLCCSIRGDLSRTVQKLVVQRYDGKLDFDRVVIETTGLADPGPIMQTLRTDRFLGAVSKIDGIVTVVDAVNAAATLDEQFEAVSQVANADLIVISKSDIASKDDLAHLQDRLAGLNPSAKIMHAARGDGVHKNFWGLTALRQDAPTLHAIAWAQPGAIDPLENLSGLSPTEPAPLTMAPHDNRIVTASLILDDPILDEDLDDFVNSLLWRHGENILRVKGIVFLNEIELPFAFHCVQQILEPPIQMKEWTSKDRRSRIVVIARDLTQDTLERSFDKLRKNKTTPTSV